MRSCWGLSQARGSTAPCPPLRATAVSWEYWGLANSWGAGRGERKERKEEEERKREENRGEGEGGGAARLCQGRSGH